MRVLHYALVMTVVLTTSMVFAQEQDKPKDKVNPWPNLASPWWISADERAVKDQPRVKDSQGDAKEPKVDKKTPARPERKPAPTTLNKPGPWTASATMTIAPPQPRERLVYQLSNKPAIEIARTINELLESERAVPGTPKPNTIVLADPISNRLIISGTSDAIHETVKFVEQLDTQPLMVHVEAVIGLIESREGLSLLKPNPDGLELSCSHAEACELIEEFSKSDAVKILARPQLMTLDNSPAFLQVGDRVPRVKSMQEGHVTGTELENVGLILSLTPRISDNHVVTMEVDLEKSQIGPEAEGVPLGVDDEGNVIRSPKIETMVVQTTVKVASGRAVIIGGLALQDGDHNGELVLVVTPHVLKQKK